MGRKVFISFLGTGNYEAIRYASTEEEANQVKPLRFFQEASLSLLQNELTEGDKILIMTTKGSMKNWLDGEHLNFKTNEKVWHEGLQSRLTQMNLRCSFENIHIADGQNTQEIWEIFSLVFQHLQEGDQLYFDITHGFRSLPMLNMVLINYAKLLKNISVEKVLYGAFEAKIKAGTLEYAPIWDLISFVELQDWTNEATLFLKTGNAAGISELIHQPEFIRLKEHLTNFSNQILVNRGLDIFSGKSAVALRQELKDLKNHPKVAPALAPILDKINHEFDDYQHDEAINGYLAVRWCIKNGLIQQAATLMEEFITTFVMVELGLKSEIHNSNKRTLINAMVTLGDDKTLEAQRNSDLQSFQDEYVEKVRALSFKKKIGRISNDLKSAIRNDINHAGFRENPRNFSDFQDSIVKRYKDLRKIIISVKNINLPEL